MILATTIAAVRARREELARRGARLALVPTMGALHDGHLSLVRVAREHADEVWASVFVNPAQFGPNEDLERYPRDLERDRKLLAEAGCTLLFAPSAREIYPAPSATVVSVPGLAAGLCGAQRPGHFDGVLLVVAKLFNIVQPSVAVFGAKDYQQAAVIRRMAADLNFPVEIVVAPTVREGDGVAMSSRNAYLSTEERAAARALARALRAGEAAVRSGERRGPRLESLLLEALDQEPGIRAQYVAVADPDTLAPVAWVSRRVLLAVAAYAGETRLIDNMIVEVE